MVSSRPAALPTLTMSLLKFPDLVLTEQEFKDLPEYSISLPTGTSEGKRWKRNLHAHPQFQSLPDRWLIGEYGLALDDGTVPINWYEPKVKMVHRPNRFGRMMARLGLYTPRPYNLVTP